MDKKCRKRRPYRRNGSWSNRWAIAGTNPDDCEKVPSGPTPEKELSSKVKTSYSSREKDEGPSSNSSRREVSSSKASLFSNMIGNRFLGCASGAPPRIGGSAGPPSISFWPAINPQKRLVGVRGFEPPAPASRRQCSTRLSYTPSGPGGVITFCGAPGPKRACRKLNGFNI